MQLSNILKQFFTVHVRLVAGIIIVLVIAGTAWYIIDNRKPSLGFYDVGKGNVISSVDFAGYTCVFLGKY